MIENETLEREEYTYLWHTISANQAYEKYIRKKTEMGWSAPSKQISLSQGGKSSACLKRRQ